MPFYVEGLENVSIDEKHLPEKFAQLKQVKLLDLYILRIDNDRGFWLQRNYKSNKIRIILKIDDDDVIDQEYITYLKGLEIYQKGVVLLQRAEEIIKTQKSIEKLQAKLRDLSHVTLPTVSTASPSTSFNKTVEAISPDVKNSDTTRSSDDSTEEL